ncbi:MAG TPA: cytochrome C oxidase subunit IV family protein [Opitutus sp.]|nr:cytochrome C oxidase subunit IV family protein [Opitutus sp.]
MRATRSTLFRSYGVLMLLLALTAAATRLPPGPWTLPVSLVIALAKTAIVFLYFMQLRYQRGLVRIFALAGFVWLGIAGLLTFADYLTRDG